MKKNKPVQFFSTVTEMRSVPQEKIDHFCEDLRLWLPMHAQIAEMQSQLGELADLVKITTPIDRFGWVDDGKHDANINITLRQETGEPG